MRNESLLTNEIDDAVGNTKSAGSLDTAAELNDLSLELTAGHLGGIRILKTLLLELETGKVFLRKVNEAGTDVLANQILAGLVLALHGNLDLEPAEAEAKVHNGIAALGLSVRTVLGGEVAALTTGTGSSANAGIVLLNLVVASDTEVDTALTDEGGDIGSGEEDESDGEVLDEGNVEAVLATELDVGALEEVQAGLQKTALCKRLWR